ncbi:MAG: mannose-1-phosphate guanylyltransferase/mannose-6-phosphate isomerase [Gammaproteobacteria bacterium]
MTPSLVPVILSGGSGTRLWPLSRELSPKQLLPLVSEHTLLQETLLRTKGLGGSVGAPVVVCNEDHRFLVAEQLLEINSPPQTIVLEPSGRNTAPAVAVAALLAVQKAADPLLLVLPADHVILDTRAFVAAVETAASAAAAGRLVTFGVVPSRPETGYGYLLRGEDRGGWSVLEKFVEKPNVETAQHYVSSGRYLWNSGMFVLSASLYLDELGRHAPKILDACRRAVAAAVADTDFTRLGSAFLDCPSDSIDYAVMEKTDRAAVVPLDAGWSDVGSWAALHDVLPKDGAGNTLRGDAIAEGCKDTYLVSTSRLVAGVGLEGIIVVETPDAVVVMARTESQSVKRVVDALKAQRRREVRVSVSADSVIE